MQWSTEELFTTTDAAKKFRAHGNLQLPAGGQFLEHRLGLVVDPLSHERLADAKLRFHRPMTMKPCCVKRPALISPPSLLIPWSSFS